MIELQIPTKDDIKTIVQQALSEFKPINYPNPDEFITKDEAGTLLKLCSSAIDNLRRRNVLKAYRIGGSVRFKRSEVIQAIEDLNR
ncbi:helix-turn-helix domain-containing protein [bacterium]|nr:helix-turn-helix domain-containing protein [Saprospiraceae bacterium]MDA9347004.1 helix-turn-helix domain-containing protein [bacterium]